MKHDQETLGRYLRREREKRHATVEELALFLGIRRSFVDALEADDLEYFPGKADGLRLVRQYTAYLNLDRSEAVRRFEGQWRMSAGLNRYPKLTHYPDEASPRKRGLSGGWRPFARVSAAKLAAGSALGILLLAVPFLASRLPDLQTMLASPAPVSPQPVAVPPAPAEPKATPQGQAPPVSPQPSGVVKRAAIPAPREPVAPPAPGGAVKAGPPKRVPAIDPLYTPPGRAERKPVPPPAGGRVVGNRDTKRYHLPGMKYYDKVREYHRVVFQTEREAIRAGYVKAPQ